jgi:large subunit ribosomal protein L23
MNRERIFQVLVAPHISEKTTNVGDWHNQYVFQVARDADKREIRKAVEHLFDVQVKAVQTLQVKGKTKNFGRQQGRRSGWKKAYVSLAAGQEIDFLAAE